MTSQSMKSSSLLQKVAGYTAQILSAICIALASLWAENTDTTKKYLGGFEKKVHSYEDSNWHAVLMTTAFGFCLVQAILAYRLLPFSHKVQKYIHGTSHAIGLTCAFIGISKMVNVRNTDPPFSNFASLHSWLGLTTFILYVQNYVLGFLHFILPLFSFEMKKLYLPNHKYLGFMTLIVAVITLETGIIQRNGTGGCDYKVSSIDTNPASHYLNIPVGCRLSSGLGIILVVILLLVGFAIRDNPQEELKLSDIDTRNIIKGPTRTYASPDSEA